MATKSEEDLQKNVQVLKEWITSQPHLPQNLEERFLIRFLHSCYYDVDDTRKALELFFKLRTSLPELLKNRDPLSPHIEKSLRIFNLARLHIGSNSNLWIWQLNDPGLEQYEHVMDVKIFLMNADSWLLEDNKMEDEDILLLDAKDITLKYLTKCNFFLEKKYFKYLQEAMPIRLHQVHVINIPPYFDKIYSVFKPLLKKELRKKIFLHTSNSDTLFDYINRENLPEDFGGTCGTLKEHMQDVYSSIVRQRDILKQDNLWVTNDTKFITARSKTGSENEDLDDIRNLVID